MRSRKEYYQQNDEEENQSQKVPFTQEEINAVFNYKTNQFNFKPKPFIMGVQPKFKTNQTITIYGARGTGKSVWLKWWLYHHRHLYPWGWVFTKTKNNGFFESFIPSSKILGSYNPKNLHAIVQRQKHMEALYLRDGKTNPNAFIIWDDALDDKLKYDDFIQQYYFNSRHWHTMNLMTAQHVIGTNTGIRQNTDFAVLFKNENKRALEHLSEDFSSAMRWQDFKTLLDKNTMDNNFFMVDNSPSVSMENKYYTGKAELITEPFVVGCRSYWANDYGQLEKILSGEVEDKLSKIKDLSDPDKVVKLFDISKPGIQDDTI